MGSTRNTTSNNQTRDPYAAAQPGLQQAGAQISSYLSNPMTSEVYSGPRVAQMTGQTSQGLDRLGAAQGANASSSYLNDVLSGKYLNTDNPHQAAMESRIKQSLMPSLNAQFSNAGMNGSTLHQGTLATALTEGLAQSRYGTYNNERGMMGQAANLLPQVDQQAAMAQIQAGQQRENYTQANYNADQALFRERQMAPLQGVNNAMPALTQLAGAGGTTSGTQTQTQTPSMGSQILGGAMMGASALGNMYTGGAMGAMGGGGMMGMGMMGNAGNGMNNDAWRRQFG